MKDTNILILIVVICGIILSVLIYLGNEEMKIPDTKYRIEFGDKTLYTNKYTTGNCIKFIDYKNINRTICGSYEIDKLK